MDETMSPSGNWMTVKTITEMMASVGIIPSRRETR